MEKNIEILSTVNKYVFLTTSDSKCYKKCKKKLIKNNSWKYFTYKEVINTDQYIHCLLDYFKEILRKGDKTIKNIGVLLDNCTILADITNLVNIPENYDILCLNADVKQYDWKDKGNNIYWNKILINDTLNFVINYESIEKVINLLKKCTDWKDFINNVNENLFIYTVSGGLLSENNNQYIHFPLEKYNSKTTSENEKQLILDTNETQYVNYLEKFPKTVIDIKKVDKLSINNELLPPISLICPFTDKDQFFNIVYTFLKLDYPSDKLELVVIDPSKSDKYLKRMLPEDSRIKILNIGNKNDETINVSLGYMLNLGVKYSKYDLICHFFDSNFYVWQSFSAMVKYYLFSDKDVMLSCDTGVYGKNYSKMHIPDIANMMYKKSFWKVLPFNSHESNKYRLIYKFIYNRFSCVAQLPFILWSFYLNNKNSNNELFGNVKLLPLGFNLEKLIPITLRESFNEIFV